MSEHAINFELSKNIERYLAALSKLYALDGNRQVQEIIVNAQSRVNERWTDDSWEGGGCGHALYLIIPERLFLSSLKKKNDVQDQIKEDLNKLHNISGEFIAAVFLEMQDSTNHEWREESGLLIDGKRNASLDATKRIWGDAGFRVFLSHKSEVKVTRPL